MWAQNMGINVYHDIDVAFDIDKSHETFTSKAPYNWLPTLRWYTPSTEKVFKTPGVELKDSCRLINGQVNAKLVCDATGFSRKLTSKFGKKETFDGWKLECDAYWAYFKEKEILNVEERLEHWDYLATKHFS